MEQERYLHEWLAKKDAYASSITGRKIIFISGSNTLFGVDTQRIEKTLGIPTVNYGTHASLLYYNLKRAQKHLKSGDVAILPLEYPYYEWHHDVFDKELAYYWLGYDYAEIKNLSLFEQIKFIAQLNTKDLAKFALQRLIPPTPTEGEYSSQYLNKNGDMTNNFTEKKRSNKALQNTLDQHAFNELPLTADTITVLGSFIDYCQTNNITVYATWPTYLWRTEEFSGTDLRAIQAIEDFYHAHNVEILGIYTDCLYDVNLFYDTRYHLNDEGKRLHTDYLINLLAPKLSK